MSSALRLRLGDQVFEATLQPGDDGHTLHVDEQSATLAGDAAIAPPVSVAGASVHELLFDLDGQRHRAVVARTPDRVLVALGGHTYAFEPVDDERSGGAASGTGRIAAPMPGKVIAIPVAVGDHVERGQPVVILEAMKMETTLVADVSGTITAITAVVDETVDGDAVLVEIEPDA